MNTQWTEDPKFALIKRALVPYVLKLEPKLLKRLARDGIYSLDLQSAKIEADKARAQLRRNVESFIQQADAGRRRLPDSVTTVNNSFEMAVAYAFFGRSDPHGDDVSVAWPKSIGSSLAFFKDFNLTCTKFDRAIEQLEWNLPLGSNCGCIHFELLKGLFNNESPKFRFELITLLRAVIPRSGVVKCKCAVAKTMACAKQYAEFALWLFGEMVNPGRPIDYLKANESDIRRNGSILLAANAGVEHSQAKVDKPVVNVFNQVLHAVDNAKPFGRPTHVSPPLTPTATPTITPSPTPPHTPSAIPSSVSSSFPSAAPPAAPPVAPPLPDMFKKQSDVKNTMYPDLNSMHIQMNSFVAQLKKVALDDFQSQSGTDLLRPSRVTYSMEDVPLPPSKFPSFSKSTVPLKLTMAQQSTELEPEYKFMNGTACATGDMSQFDQKSHELPPSSNLNIMTGEEYTDFVDYLSAAESFSESEDVPDEDEKQEPHKNQTFLDSLKKFYFF